MSRVFYGQFDPPVDRFLFERYFPDAGIRGIFVECGAFDGTTESSCRFFEESLGWTGWNLEPVEHLFTSLCRNRPRSRNLKLGLSNACGESRFTLAVSPTFGRDCNNGSIRHAESHERALRDAGFTFETLRIDTVTWSALVAAERMTHVDLLVLDVEGHEIEVLEGMKGCLVLPDVLCIEFGHLGIDRIRVALAELGYSYDITSHANAFFVRNDKLALFALRRAAAALPTSTVGGDGGSLALMRQNQLLEQRLGEVTALYHAVVGSRSWRWIERIKRLLGRGR